MRLSLRRTGLAPPIYADRADWTILDAGQEVGRTYEDTYASQPWYWAVFVTNGAAAGIRTSGRADTLEEAKEQFRTNNQRWLVWSKLEDGS